MNKYYLASISIFQILLVFLRGRSFAPRINKELFSEENECFVHAYYMRKLRSQDTRRVRERIVKPSPDRPVDIYLWH